MRIDRIDHFVLTVTSIVSLTHDMTGLCNR